MAKKILLGAVALLVVVAGVAALSAYEAHVINVTAHIENSLSVSTDAIEFGTVFPQEYAERTFFVNLSTSFLGPEQTRVKDVQYKIVQKPKCVRTTPCPPPRVDPDCSYYLPVDPATDQCPAGYAPMSDLCRFLSKLPVTPELNDVGVPSYYNSGTKECSEPSSHIATGRLEKCLVPAQCGEGDTSDCWTVDLKVPPVAGSVGQDWPASCAGWTVPTDGADYGCDLWVEVTGFSYF